MRLLIFIYFVIYSFPLCSQNKELLDYFKQNAVSFNSQLSIPKSYLEGNSVFLCGEVHGVPSNQKLEFELFKYFYGEAEVRCVLVELGNSDAFLMNKYLETNDESFIREKIKPFKLSFLRNLKKFNDSIDEKVKIIGVDFERDEAIYQAFEHIFQSDPPHLIKDNIEELKNAFRSDINKKYRKQLFRKTQSMIIEYESYYKRYLGDYYELFLSIISNKVPVTSRVKRDKYMARNFLHKNEDSSCRYYGNFGISHTNKSFKNFANQITFNRDSNIKYAVLVIQPYYINCSGTYKNEIIRIHDVGLLAQENIKNRIEIGEEIKADIALVDLRNLSAKYNNLKEAANFVLMVKNQNVD